ncbi:EthD family reductase [Bacillus sp. ISL-41]|uniref:EthD family reductase n=1 Tax=Bacillus sp. ISL-41 TaxID=2819127 RepID=UPI001BEA4284|nr:EthD family reductase [Bacillus sp. ISL-41]MBT2642846.1 EthD family reductase [Bacillus sp. ISL-41]
MAKIIVTYDQPKDQAGFEKHYYDVHIPLVQKVPNLKGAEVHRVLQSMYTDEKLYLIAELQFDNPEVLAQSLATPEFQEVQGDVKNLITYLNKPPVVAIVD